MRRDILEAAIEAAEQLEAAQNALDILEAALNLPSVDVRTAKLRAELQIFLDETTGAIIEMSVVSEA